MIQKKIVLKKDTPDHVYTEFCNLCEKQGIFKASGNCDDKWIIVEFENDIDLIAWMASLNNGKARQ